MCVCVCVCVCVGCLLCLCLLLLSYSDALRHTHTHTHKGYKTAGKSAKARASTFNEFIMYGLVSHHAEEDEIHFDVMITDTEGNVCWEDYVDVSILVFILFFSTGKILSLISCFFKRHTDAHNTHTHTNTHTHSLSFLVPSGLKRNKVPSALTPHNHLLTKR